MRALIARDPAAVPRGSRVRLAAPREFRYPPAGRAATAAVFGISILSAGAAVGLWFASRLPPLDTAVLVLVCLAFGLWLAVYFVRARRAVVRVDGDGISFAGAFTRRTIPWNEVTALESSRFELLAGGVLTTFCRVHARDRAIRLESRIEGFDELLLIVPEATGLQSS